MERIGLELTLVKGEYSNSWQMTFNDNHTLSKKPMKHVPNGVKWRLITLIQYANIGKGHMTTIVSSAK